MQYVWFPSGLMVIRSILVDLRRTRSRERERERERWVNKLKSGSWKRFQYTFQEEVFQVIKMQFWNAQKVKGWKNEAKVRRLKLREREREKFKLLKTRKCNQIEEPSKELSTLFPFHSSSFLLSLPLFSILFILLLTALRLIWIKF